MNLIARPTASLADCVAWAKKKRAHSRFVNEIIPALWEAHTAQAVANNGRHIDPVVVIAQSAKETGFGKFGGVINETFHNTAGIKTGKGGPNSAPNAHQRFRTWAEGARAHYNHLAAYTGLKVVGVPHDRYNVVVRLPWAGTVRTVQELGARWAPNPLYGADIARMAREIPGSAAGTTNPVPTATACAVTIRPRKDWGAVAPKAVTPLVKSKVANIFLHHTTGNAGASIPWLKSIQRYHMVTKNWNDIAYNVLVDKDGVAWEGRGWDAVGGHTKDWNSRSVAIAYLGDGISPVPEKALATIKQLFEDADKHFGKKLKRGGHRDVGATACPGTFLYEWLTKGMPL